MFEMSERLSRVFPESADEAYEDDASLNVYHAAQMPDQSNQKIFLPPGSGQSRFAPPSYYYLASKGGVTPSWVIDELHRARSFNLSS
jgi:hypothetical protein